MKKAVLSAAAHGGEQGLQQAGLRKVWRENPADERLEKRLQVRQAR